MANTITGGDATTSPSTSQGAGYWDLIDAVATYAGVYPPSGRALQRVRNVVDVGIENFLYPSNTQHKRRPHVWSFLTPLSTLDVVADTDTYDLPENFTGFNGKPTWQENNTSAYVSVIREEKVRMLHNERPTSGDPVALCIRPKQFSSDATQVYEVRFYPTPGRDLTLEYRYTVDPGPFGTPIVQGNADLTEDTLTDTDSDFSNVSSGDKVILHAGGLPDPGIYQVDTVTSDTELDIEPSHGSDGSAQYEIIPGTIHLPGSAAHKQAYRLACLSAAEQEFDDQVGVHSQQFPRYLQSAIQRDESMKPSRNLGRLVDGGGELSSGGHHVPDLYYDGEQVT